MKRKQWVGLSMPRAESVEKVTGRALYAVDVSFPGMLWGKVLRSPIPHGRIKRININKALRLPGVRAIVTGLDVATIKIGRQIYDMPVLADGVVRFTGAEQSLDPVREFGDRRPWRPVPVERTDQLGERL